MMMRMLHPTLPLTLLFLLGAPTCSWALQPHGPPEGLYVHQMAHLLFIGALGYLYLHTRSTPDLISRGWRYLQTFCLLLIAWNIVAFTGHIMVVLHAARPAGAPFDLVEFLYHLTRMDHFLYVPALVCLTISLYTFHIEARKGECP